MVLSKQAGHENDSVHEDVGGVMLWVYCQNPGATELTKLITNTIQNNHARWLAPE